MWRFHYILRKSVQHEIQVRPGEVSKQRWHDADGAEMPRLMVVVVTVRKVYVWVLCSIWFYGDENVLKKGGQLPRKEGAMAKRHVKLEW